MRMAEVLRRVGITARDPGPEYVTAVVIVHRLFAAGGDRSPGPGVYREYSARDVEVIEMRFAFRDWGWSEKDGSRTRRAGESLQDRVLAWVRENGWPDEPTSIQNEGGCTIWIPARSWWQPVAS